MAVEFLESPKGVEFLEDAPATAGGVEFLDEVALEAPDRPAPVRAAVAGGEVIPQDRDIWSTGIDLVRDTPVVPYGELPQATPQDAPAVVEAAEAADEETMQAHEFQSFQKQLNPLEPPVGNVGTAALGTLTRGAADAAAGVLDFLEPDQVISETAGNPANQHRLDAVRQRLTDTAAQRDTPQYQELLNEARELSRPMRENTFAGKLSRTAANAAADAERVPGAAGSIARGVGGFASFLPALALGPGGATAFAAAGAESGARTATADDLRAGGVTDETEIYNAAKEAGNEAAAKAAMQMPLYYFSGRLAAASAGKLLPNATRFKTVAAQTIAATGANVVSGAMIRTLEGGEAIPNLEQFTMDALWGAVHGVGVNVSEKAKTRARVEMESRGLTPQQIDNPNGVADLVPAIRVGEQVVKGNTGETHQDVIKRFATENPEQAGDAWANFGSKENPNFFVGPDEVPISREQLQDRFGVSDSQGLRERQAQEVGTPSFQRLTLEEGGEGNVGLTEVMKSYEGVLQSVGSNTPIRSGRLGPGARSFEGVYKVDPEVARTRRWGQIDVGAHEAAHGIQHKLFGTVDSAPLISSLPSDVVRELGTMGRALYGSKKPSNGYESEGWAEFFRHYLTTDNAAKVAPKTLDYVENVLFPSNEKFAESMQSAKTQTDTYRKEGALNRFAAMHKDTPGVIKRAMSAIAEPDSFTENIVDSLVPLRRLREEFREATGKTLSPSKDPYELASFQKMRAPAVTYQMVTGGMVDPWGNQKTDASGNPIGSLRDILIPVRKQRKEFAAYLVARHTQELQKPTPENPKGRESGMPLEDANRLVAGLEARNPQFAIQADKLYGWKNAVLDYLVDLNPEMADAVKAMKAANPAHVPLGRDFTQEQVKRQVLRQSGNPLQRLRGSLRPIKNIYDQLIANTNRIVSAAHRASVLRSVAELSETTGVGHLVEEVPRDSVANRVSIDQIRSDLDNLGIDTSSLKGDEVLKFWTMAQQPKGKEPIISLTQNGKTKWFQVSPKAFEIVNGMDPARESFLWRALIAAPSRLLRLGTTGLRAAFGLFTNPARDLQTLLFQTQTRNPAKAFALYLKSIGEKTAQIVSKKASTPYADLFDRLGMSIAQPLGSDIAQTRALSKRLTDGRIATVVKHPLEAVRELFGVTEKVPRIAELRATAERVGWKPGTPATPDQAVAMGNAAAKATVDFRQGGRLSKTLNDLMVFFNPSVQGIRSFYRQFKENPTRASLRAAAFTLGPALALWWWNKDKKWYKELSNREKYLYWNFEGPNGNVIQIPRPQEFSAWGGLLEGTLNQWVAQDPEGLKASLGNFLDMHNPVDYPTLVKLGKEQWENRMQFWDRPIVPRGQQDLPKGEQFGEHTSEAAKALGRLFPNTISPRRVDYAARQLLGGVGGDILKAPDIVTKAARPGEEFQGTDVPVFGRALRFGGQFSGNSASQDRFWKDYGEFQARSRSKIKKLEGTSLAYWKSLDEAHDQIKDLNEKAAAETNVAQRRNLHERATDVARAVLLKKPK